MTDRELLEAAAKAAGLRINDDQQAARDAIMGSDCSLWINEVSTAWNPLRDNGHALGLAVALNMAVSIHTGHCMACAQLGAMQTETGDDTAAATRRAIVRAAAALSEPTP